MNSESLRARRSLAGLTSVLVAFAACLGAFANVAAATPGTGFGVVADDYPAQLDGVPEGKHKLYVSPFEAPIECEAPVVDQTAYGPLGTHTGLEAESFAGQSCYNNKGGKLAIDMHGCAFSFDLGESLSAGETEGNFDIVCPPGEHMTIQMPLFPCVLNVFEQKNLAARLHNQGEDVAIEAEASVHGVFSGSKAICGTSETTALWIGTWNLSATAAEKPIGVELATLPELFLSGSAGGSPLPRLEANGYTKQVTGVGSSVFTPIPGVSATCEETGLSGQLTAASSSLSLDGKYGECTSHWGGETNAPTVVEMHSCHYTLGVLNEGPPYAGSLGIGCTVGGDVIEYKVYTSPAHTTLICTYKLAPQSGRVGLDLANTGPGSEGLVTVEDAAQGISWETKGLCGKTSGTAGVLDLDESLDGS